MGADSIVLQCYTAIVPRERGQNPGTGKKNLKIVLDSNTRKCYNRVKKTENRTGIGAEKVTAIRNLDF